MINSDGSRHMSGVRRVLFVALSTTAVCGLVACGNTTSDAGITESGQCTFNDAVVEITGDDVPCANATETLQQYMDRRDTEGGGNAMVLDVNGWVCNTPTAAVAEADSSQVECSRRDNDNRLVLKKSPA